MALGDPIPIVSDDALILTDWGNAVAAEVNDSVKKHLPQVMAAGSSLTAPTLMISTNQITTAPSANHAIRSDYAAANYFNRASGGFITGGVVISPVGAVNQCLRLSAPAPILDWWNDAGSARMGYITVSTSGMTVYTDAGAIAFLPDGVQSLRVVNAHTLVGMTVSSAYADAGVDMSTDGSVHITTSLVGDRNLNCNHIGAADAGTQQWIRFSRTTTGTNIGAITQVGTTGTAYGEGSDRRMKTIVGPVPDAADRLRALKPYRVSWNGDDTRPDSDAFIADEIDPVVPGAVVGEANAVDDDGAPAYQMVDYGKVVPLLTAALQTALDRIDTLEARVAELEAA